ncbi:MAG: ATP-binding protein, partial [Polyangiaceae bacterium]|nr:ATP-binding protein [Polyangiaceae bacterium]
VDALLMQQLLVNLLENAAKHTPEGSAIDLRTEVAENALVVEVGDRGPGIHEGDEERIFERFYRGPKARASGVGLGLPICRAIAQAHGGTIRARNRPGGGAVFQVSIPLVGTPPSMRAMAEEEEREG